MKIFDTFTVDRR